MKICKKNRKKSLSTGCSVKASNYDQNIELFKGYKMVTWMFNISAHIEKNRNTGNFGWKVDDFGASSYFS